MVTTSRTGTISGRAALALASVANLAITLDAVAMFAVYPQILMAFSGTPAATLSWILNAYTIVFASLLVPAGKLADRFGRRRLYFAGALLYSLGAAACAIAPSAELIAAARTVQGTGAALLIPSSLALVLASFPEGRRAGAVNLWVAGGSIGGVMAPTLGALVALSFGWRWVFLLQVPVGLLALALKDLLWTRSDGEGRQGMPDLPGLALLVVGISLLAFGIVRGDGQAAAVRAGVVVLGLALLGGFGARSLKVREPAVDLKLLAHRVRGRASIAMFVFGTTFSATFLGYNLFLTRQWGFSIMETGLAITAGPATALLAATLARPVANAFGHRALLLPGAAAYGVAGLLFVQAVGRPPDLLAFWLPGMVVGGAGVGLLLPSLSGLSVFGLSEKRFALGIGVNQAIRQLGGVLGVALVLGLLQGEDQAAAYRLTYLSMAVGGLLIAVITLPVIRGPRVIAGRSPADDDSLSTLGANPPDARSARAETG